MRRSVRSDPSVDAEIEEARSDWPRIDQAWDVIVWVLAHDPTAGAPLTEGGTTRAFVYVGSYAHEMPNVEVLYVDEDPFLTVKHVTISTPIYSAGSA